LTPGDRTRLVAGFGHFPALLQSALIDAAWGVLSDQTRADVGRLITGLTDRRTHGPAEISD